MKRSTTTKAGAAALAGAAIYSSGATALTSNFTVSIEFFDPFTATETTPSTFGRLISGVATTYSMDFNGNLTAGPGGSGTGGSPTAGQYSIFDSSTGQVVDIIVDNPVSDIGVAIIGFDCSWNAGAATDNGATCMLNAVANPTGGGATLDLGFDISVDGTQQPLDVARPTFDVSVLYD